MGVAQLLIWAIWAGVTRHPSRWKLWLVVVGEGLAMLLQIYDFPPYRGFVDAHALYHAANIPLTYLWWSFIRDDTRWFAVFYLVQGNGCGILCEVEEQCAIRESTQVACLARTLAVVDGSFMGLRCLVLG
ncbi:hypothetical protein KPL71_025552 [Citrus sinensis]|uniref:Uncharacterized protein n=1 Tax=Citrus sinensis TaxID=2711 RepID=A0ACB8HTB6_CITSI|nr:hypothetical protein KPL71_025552 [Citrus sinensis]